MPRSTPRDDETGTTRDLFEHFGVEEREPAPDALPGARPARTCAGCGWYVTDDGTTCPQCGAVVNREP